MSSQQDNRELQDLYRELILDHARKPRNFRRLESATHTAEGINPLCGDKLRLYLQVDANDTVIDAGFEGSGCAISMASAAYLQSKAVYSNQEQTRSPIVSAITTGIAYISTVIILALPYFFTEGMAYAFGVSVALALSMTAFFTFYSSVILEKKFSRELLEGVGLTLGTAFITFMFGSWLGSLFGISGWFDL